MANPYPISRKDSVFRKQKLDTMILEIFPKFNRSLILREMFPKSLCFQMNLHHPSRQISANFWEICTCFDYKLWGELAGKETSTHGNRMKLTLCRSDLFTDKSCVSRLKYLFVWPGSDIQHSQYALRSKPTLPCHSKCVILIQIAVTQYF